MHTVFRQTSLALAVLSILGSLPKTAQAQESDPSAQAMEQIEVTGYRRSLIQAKDLKKDALGTQDTILAEDIADFPDLNLAESLQRCLLYTSDAADE